MRPFACSPHSATHTQRLTRVCTANARPSHTRSHTHAHPLTHLDLVDNVLNARSTRNCYRCVRIRMNVHVERILGCPIAKRGPCACQQSDKHSKKTRSFPAKDTFSVTRVHTYTYARMHTHTHTQNESLLLAKLFGSGGCKPKMGVVQEGENTTHQKRSSQVRQEEKIVTHVHCNRSLYTSLRCNLAGGPL